MRLLFTALSLFFLGACSSEHADSKFEQQNQKLGEALKVIEDNKELIQEFSRKTYEQEQEIKKLKVEIADLQKELHNKPASPNVSVAGISGKVYFKLQSGQIIKMASSEVILIDQKKFPQKAAETMYGMQLLYKGEKQAGLSQLESDGGKSSLNGFSKMLDLIRPSITAVGTAVTTDSEGVFNFPLPNEGEYYLYSEFKASSAAAYWCFKVDVVADKSL
ncbi:MAG: hypothetical protein HC904_04865 [Blastochloris sp.]|nr:hypothetical protein [Blastochloris sp.]